MSFDTQNRLTAFLAFVALALFATVLSLIWSRIEWTPMRRWVATGTVVVFMGVVGFLAFQFVQNIE